MDPTQEEARLGARAGARAARRAHAPDLEVRIGRAIATAVIVGLLASFLALALLHRGAVVRQVVAEVATAAQTASATLTRDVDQTYRGLDATPLLRALLELHAVERVTWLPGAPEPPLSLTRDGAEAAAWRLPSEVPLGQWLGAERFRLARRVAHSGGSDSVLVVEGSLAHAVRREAEIVSYAARVFALVVLLTLVIAPWFGRRIAAPWTRAIRAHHARILGVAPEASDPALVLEAVERQVMSERNARAEATSRPSRALELRAPTEQAAFVLNTSHELRTPLHAIVTTSALLLDTALDLEQRAMVERVALASDALEASIGDLYELSELERGDFAAAAEPFSPEDVLDAAVIVIAPLARDRDLELLPRIDPAVPASVIGDFPRLRRVLVHLVDNAVRHTEHGVVEVRLAYSTDDGARGRLQLEVRDTGVGIELERQPMLVAALQGVPMGETGVREGLGLGLALSSRIVSALGGALEFESTPELGSTFRASVPVALHEAHASDPLLTGQRVLVLEDRPRSLAHLSDLLREEGASVVSEATTYAGFEALTRGERIDYVMLSTSLAGHDAFLGGLETLSLGRETLPGVLLVRPILGRRLPDRALDEAVAAQLVEPITRRSLRRGLELARSVALAEPDQVEAPDDDPMATAPEPALRAPHASSTAVKVLLVDDNETNRQLVQYLLTKRGYAVDAACDGQSALDAFALGQYDVVLMDCQMPGMDGFEATRRMRALERTRARRTPILAMSASAFACDVQACREAGMDDHIAKPFQPKEMLAWLEVWVARALHDTRGAVAEPPRRRVTAREVGLVRSTERGRDVPPLEGAVDDRVLGPLLEDEGGRSLAAELFALFSDSAPETLSSLALRLDSGELDEVARIAHRFVSTSGSVGAVRLARLLREVEGACKRQRQDEASALVARVDGELQAASVVLRRRLGRATSARGSAGANVDASDDIG